MKKTTLLFAILTVFLGLFLNSCQKKFTPDNATGEDNTQADNAVADVFFFAHQETSGDKALISADSNNNCYKVTTTIDSVNKTRTTTIEFDSCDVFGNGVVRNGKIIINWQLGWMFDTSKTVTVTFDKFSRNNHTVDGKLYIKFTREEDENGKMHPIFSIKEQGMSLTFPDGKTVTWDGQRTVKWYAGFNTPRIRNDNAVEVNYTRNGVNRNGESFTAIAENVYIDKSCQYNLPLKGTLTITKENGDKFKIDFGDGSCDNCVIYEQNGNQVEVCGD